MSDPPSLWETPIEAFRAPERHDGRLGTQAASTQPHCAFFAFAPIRLATALRGAKAFNRCFPGPGSNGRNLSYMLCVE